jgi:hypothetical protein
MKEKEKKQKLEDDNMFKTLVLKNKYIDKTKYIEEIEKTEKNSLICFRPRRFGKTLVILMLKEYYNIKNENETTFDNLYIGKNPTKIKNQFLILHFDFSGINITNFEEFNKLFNNYINGKIIYFLIEYKDYLTPNYKNNNENCNENLNDLIEEIRCSKQKLYILIDDYDTIVNKCLKIKNEKENIEKIENIFQCFFSNIKKYTQNGVYAFVTGVTPLELSELFHTI